MVGIVFDPLQVFDGESHATLSLSSGGLPADKEIVSLGHEPNGYFWEGVAVFLLQRDVPELIGSFRFDSDVNEFVVHSVDRVALERLGALMAPYVRNPDLIRLLVNDAEIVGFEFDD